MGGRSRAAAQLLAGQGFEEVYNLKGGIHAWQGLRAEGPAEMGMASLKGDEGPREVVVLSYGMEEGLRSFYSIVAGEAQDREVADLLSQLGKIEERHKQRLFDLYNSLEGDGTDREVFESRIVPAMMEGGFTTEDFLEGHRPLMETPAGVLGIAMMLETQALDLYMRYSQKTENAQSKVVLFEIAEEEKAHLAALGRLIEEKG